jgi:hypothetical protein
MRWNVNFTNQQPNQLGALLGSQEGKYSTLDLNEASDRVSVDLVRLLFPNWVQPYLFACRSLSTVLPGGKEITLRKFAPMGSALCFPVLALTVWSLLTAGAPDQDTRDSILVYGDDVIVPTAYAESAMTILESFGLRVNRDKSCTKGFFRESCGMDAYKGIPVTPVRIRTVWTSSPSPESYTSWIAYANNFYDRKCFNAYDYIVGKLVSVYGPIPGDDMSLTCPSLRETPVPRSCFRARTNASLQKREYYVYEPVARRIRHELDGWSMLLRFFTESGRQPQLPKSAVAKSEGSVYEFFSVRLYTKR